MFPLFKVRTRSYLQVSFIMLTSKRGGSFMFVKMEKQTNQTKRKYLQIAQFCWEILCSIHLILINTHAVCENAFLDTLFPNPNICGLSKWHLCPSKMNSTKCCPLALNQILGPYEWNIKSVMYWQKFPVTLKERWNY